MQRYQPQKSFVQKKENVVRDWYHVDAGSETLGRMASEIARLLMGKNKPTYTSHVDCGDFVVVTNAEKVRVTGQKEEKKLYRYHTGYIGGLRTHNLEWMRANKPDQVVRLAVRRMLPKNKLGRQMLRKLKVYAGAEHQNNAQQPKTISFAG
ncbi:MAG: 50S ribosomal protein L13 [Planctomycetota bacterium]